MRRASRFPAPPHFGPFWPDVPTLFVCVIASLMWLQVGCLKTPAKYQYGNSEVLQQPVRLTPEDQAGARAATDQPAIRQRTGDSVPGHAHFLSDVDSALQEAQASGKRGRIFLLITDGKSEECLRWESLLLAPEVLKEKNKRGWIFVRAETSWQKQILANYKLDPSDLPVGIVISDKGHENYRFTQAPSSAAVMRQWLIDRA